MDFFSYYPLKEKLAKGTFTDRESLPYLIVMVCLGSLSITIQDHWNLKNVLVLVLAVAISVWGILYSFKQNGKADGRDFVMRFVVISWITTLRFLVIFLIISVPSYAWSGYMDPDTFENSWPMLIFKLALLALFYQRIGYHLSEIRELSEQNDADNQGEWH